MSDFEVVNFPPPARAGPGQHTRAPYVLIRTCVLGNHCARGRRADLLKLRRFSDQLFRAAREMRSKFRRYRFLILRQLKYLESVPVPRQRIRGCVESGMDQGIALAPVWR